MLDTIKIQSPSISEDVAARVEYHLNTRQGIENASGVLMYEIVAGEVPLDGSFDHRVRVAVLRRRPVWIPGKGTQRGQTVLEDCPPYLEVEGSVHKAMVGHNCWGGPVSIRQAVTWLVFDLCKRFDTWLPYGPAWHVRRLDWANVYDLGSGAVVGDYLWTLNQASYPRRKPQNYGRRGAFFSGDTTAVKFYHKGPEFLIHDFPRIRRSPAGGPGLAREIAVRADRLLRVEVSIKAPALDRAYGGRPTVDAVDPSWVADVWEAEVQKIVREGCSDMTIVRKGDDVSARLYEVYGGRLGNALFVTWFQLSALGEERAKERMHRATFYRHRAKLVLAGCSWHGADAVFLEAPSLVPADFVPTRLDRRRLVEMHPRVLECLERVS